MTDIEKELRNLKTKKANAFGNIPPKLKELFNNTLLTSSFPTELKVADVSAVFKNHDSLKTKNYRSVTVLPVVSNISERLFH